jgi:hypothetical protein
MSAAKKFYQQTVRLERFYRVSLQLIDKHGAAALRTFPGVRTDAKVATTLSHVRRYLFELVLIRLVASIEAFLIDTVRSVYEIDKTPFLVSSKKHEFRQDQLLKLKSTKDIESIIIEKECRRLSAGGYPEIRKFYSGRLATDIENLSNGSNQFEFYFDTRNVLIHRQGETDSQYREKHRYRGKYIIVKEEILDTALQGAKAFRIQLHKSIGKQFFPKKKKQ